MKEGERRRRGTQPAKFAQYLWTGRGGGGGVGGDSIWFHISSINQCSQQVIREERATRVGKGDELETEKGDEDIY